MSIVDKNQLFEAHVPRPLADILRPKILEDVVGQDHLLGSDGAITRMVERGRLVSMILWGPPGCGKTTVGKLLAYQTKSKFELLSAVSSGLAELRKIFRLAREDRAKGFGTILFVDEIHRFNRMQQDCLLPNIEDGTVVLVGATTENPSFELIGALLSRCHVFILNGLDDEALEKVLLRVEDNLQWHLPLGDEARQTLRTMAGGDGRFLISLCEELYNYKTETPLDSKVLAKLVQRRRPLYDKGRDSHYNFVSALHKSMRGSDVDAALYWLARMLVGGEDPLFVVRRLVRFAYEDVGLADPQAAIQALASWDCYERLGSPEGELSLAQAVIYLATAPKSNAVYKALDMARESANSTGGFAPPNHAINAPTPLMAELGHGSGYRYEHDVKSGFSSQKYFPENMRDEAFYFPVERGFERQIKKRLEYWNKLRSQRQPSSE